MHIFHFKLTKIVSKANVYKHFNPHTVVNLTCDKIAASTVLHRNSIYIAFKAGIKQILTREIQMNYQKCGYQEVHVPFGHSVFISKRDFITLNREEIYLLS